MPTATYSPIASATLSATSAGVTFSNIPATYTHLVLVMDSTFATAGLPTITVNGDTNAANYVRQTLRGQVSAVASQTNSTGLPTLGDSSAKAAIVAHLFNYSSTAVHKSILSRAGSGIGNSTRITGIRWASTSALTSILLQPSGGPTVFEAGSTFNLYGIVS